MTHERHPYVLDDSGLHQASVEGVAKIVKPNMAESSAPERTLPSSLHDADRLAAETDDKSRVGLATVEQELAQSSGERDLAALPLWGF